MQSNETQLFISATCWTNNRAPNWRWSCKWAPLLVSPKNSRRINRLLRWDSPGEKTPWLHSPNPRRMSGIKRKEATRVQAITRGASCRDMEMEWFEQLHLIQSKWKWSVMEIKPSENLRFSLDQLIKYSFKYLRRRLAPGDFSVSFRFDFRC